MSRMDRSSKQNINKAVVPVNDTLGQMDLTDTHTTFHPKGAKYTFFSNAYGTFSKIGQMLGPRTRLNKVKKTEIISSIFSDHRGMKLESNLKKKTQKTFTFMETKWHAMKQ